jgi:hypothetical protein
MADVTPASATLQGIPPELRNKIYVHLLTEPRNVSVRKFLKLREEGRGGFIWEQFQSAIAVHPLTLTCRQMRSEFSSVLTTTPGQTYCFIVDNLDPHQLALFREFTRTYCFSERASDKSFPPILIEREVVLCLKLDGKILPSIEAYVREAQVQHRRGSFRVILREFSEIKSMIMAGSSVFGDSTSKSKSMTKAQAEVTRRTARGIYDVYEAYGLYKLDDPEQQAISLLFDHSTAMADNHS